MLSFLKISNLAILEDVSIEPGPGLNVLTGETGAGKSIVVDAIGLVLGGRGSADLIRSGCDRLVVEALFELSHRPDAAGIIRRAGLPDDMAADQLVIRRELAASGGMVRSRATVNGVLVSMTSLQALGEGLADIHGQNQHQSLLRPEGQRDALDSFAGTMALRGDIGALHSLIRSIDIEREELVGRERDRMRHEEGLREQIAEIEACQPRPGEDEALSREEGLLRHATEVSRLATEAFGLLSDDDDSVLAKLGGIDDRLQRLAAIDPAVAAIRALIAESRFAGSEAARSLAGYVDTEQLDPARLDDVAGRLAELERLKRKYGPSLEEVLAYLERARSELETFAGAAGRLEEINRTLEQSRRRYREIAGALSSRRRKAAARLTKAIEKEAAALGMEGTRVEIAIEDGGAEAFGVHGTDILEFLIAPNRGEELRPLSRIASGGELSRLMLALRNGTESTADHRTLIFDEVDSGIGGRVAEVVGQRLAMLGRRQQVLCVTHLPQIAVHGDLHFQVTKLPKGDRTCAGVERLDEEARIEELARMLGGAPRETARRHAAAMVRTATRRGRATT